MTDAFTGAISTNNLLLNILLAAIWSMGAAGCFAICLNSARRDIVKSAILGAIGWILYLTVFGLTNSLFGGYFLGAFVVAVFSELLASLQKTPATIFILPGILPLVPGGGMFYTMEAALTGHLENAARLGYQTIGAAGAIALGIALATSTARILRRMKVQHHTSN